MEGFQITSKRYFEEYMSLIGREIKNLVKSFDFNYKDSDPGYQTQASAVYSSNIEGNTIDLNSFMNFKLSNEKFKPGKEIKEIEDLILAYDFAQKEILNQKNFRMVHKILAETLLIIGLRGKYRNDKVGVFGDSGLVYLAIESEFVQETMNEFFSGIEELLSNDLSMEEVFYFASLIHLKFVHIHPFRDGNGRAARILEKWFIAAKLGEEFWKLPSEKYYRDNQAAYYKNLNLGVNYYELNYDKSLPFLAMLPNCMK
ncbi:MAG TPA: Fic family protein [Catalimonadaceae bacterium]|nr:Fic family protein [Catalimonadaceae bacterium]HPI11861.1 Fic family protein [Catalimonadaceae bacterium]